ncbi:MAG: hypothetical protein QF687_06680, partial [Nitrospinaceae bacterium]|nr:hypothetical protein [Nitrospinaceae bacterium]
MTSKSTETETVLADARNRFGFEPNVIREMATNPVSARLYLKARTSLRNVYSPPREHQAVQLAIAAHTAGGKMTGCDLSDMQIIFNGGVPTDASLANVVKAARMVHSKKGWLDEKELTELEQLRIDRPRLYEIVV